MVQFPSHQKAARASPLFLGGWTMWTFHAEAPARHYDLKMQGWQWDVLLNKTRDSERTTRQLGRHCDTVLSSQMLRLRHVHVDHIVFWGFRSCFQERTAWFVIYGKPFSTIGLVFGHAHTHGWFGWSMTRNLQTESSWQSKGMPLSFVGITRCVVAILAQWLTPLDMITVWASMRCSILTIPWGLAASTLWIQKTGKWMSILSIA